MRFLAENASEDPVHVGQVAVHGKGLLNLFKRKIRKDFLVGLDSGAEIALGFPGAHGVCLHHAVGLFPQHSGGGQIQQKLPREDQAVGAIPDCGSMRSG